MDSPEKFDDLSRAKHSAALLAACIVETANDSDPTFKARFLDRLAEAHQLVRHEPQTDGEVFSWVREILTGFSFSKGPGKPFLPER